MQSCGGVLAGHGRWARRAIFGWARIAVSGGTPSVDDHENVSSLTDNGAGDVTVTWITPHKTAGYGVSVFANYATLGTVTTRHFHNLRDIATTSVRTMFWDWASAAASDPDIFWVCGVNDY